MFLKEKALLTPTVKDIEQVLNRPRMLLAVKENSSVMDAARKMADNQVGCLVVLDEKNRFVGILTERDMLAKVTSTTLAPDKSLVSEIMTPEPLSCTLETPIEKLQQLMAEHKIRHVPIVKEGQPVGMVSSRDLIAYQLHNSKAKKTAAEQLVMLSTELKSLNLKEVVSLALNETPKNLGAERAVLLLSPESSSDCQIHRKNCSLSREDILHSDKINSSAKTDQVVLDSICNECIATGAKTPRLIIPLNIQEQINGDEINQQNFLCMCCFNSSSLGDEKLLLYKASLLKEILSINLTNAKLYHNYQQVRRESERDALTDVGSRRILEQVLKAEYDRSIRYKHCFSVAIVDVDHFKGINDNAGHAAGDRTLKQVAKMMRRSIRTTDIIIIRYGGDEFVLLMPETNIDQATVLLERIRMQAKEISVPNVPPITISCGVAQWASCAEDVPKLILNRADKALYQAKRTGRDRVVARSTEPVGS